MHDLNERSAASLELVVFLNKYAELLSEQLGAIRKLIEEAVIVVMDNVNTLSQETAQKASEVEKQLTHTYLNPDQKTSDLVEAIQGNVDELFALASKDLANTHSKATSSTAEKQRRLGGQFSKSMEAIGTMDEALSQMLMDMMAALSNDDVIRQKLEHVLQMVNALQVGMSYVMIDFKNKFTQSEVDALKADLLAYTYKIYTCESEKDIQKAIFGLPTEVKFSIFRS